MTCSQIKIILLAVLLFSACSITPDLEKSKNPDEEELVSIAYLKSLYANTPVFIDREIRFVGRVISSDRYANIYKTLYIEDATGGIAIKIDQQEIFEFFTLGNSVLVNCNSLTLGSYGGVIQLGVASDDGMYQVSPIPANILGSVVLRRDEPNQEVIPTTLTFQTLEHHRISCLVSFNNVQFIDEEMGLSWSDSDVSSDRHLVDIQGDTLVVRTNYYSLFAPYTLPIYSGTVKGILSYFNRKYQLIMVSHHDAIMNKERFIPSEK